MADEKKRYRVRMTRVIRQEAAINLWASSAGEAAAQAPKWPVRWENVDPPDDVTATIEEIK